MTLKNPPRIAAWMLEHVIFGRKNDALAGDLLEEFRHGRSAIWYWRQVLMAIGIGLAMVLCRQWMAIGYAILWAVPFPAFMVLVVRRVVELPLFAQRWRFDWPYSMMCDLLLSYVSVFLYLWLALALYFGLFSWATGVFNLPRLAKSLWISAFVYAIISGALFVLFAFLPRHNVYTFDVRHVTSLQLITGSFFWESRLPIFLSLLLPILMALPRVERARKATT